MAGTASNVPAMTPFTTSWAICSRNGGIAGSGHFEECELALVHFVVAEFAVDDVADVREIAGAARALVVDLLALRQQLQAFDGTVDLGAAPLRDLAHVVADAGAG